MSNAFVTGVILAGGKSARMGEDKAFISFSGKPLIESVIHKLSSIFDDLMIVTNKPEAYKKYGVNARDDIIKGCGPLGGIYTGLVSSNTMFNFVCACDMPFLNQDLMKFMTENLEGSDVVMPRYNGKLEPLCAIYSKACVEPIEKELQENNLKITNFLRHVKARIVNEQEIAKIDPEGKCFVNINTYEEYSKCMPILRNRL